MNGRGGCLGKVNRRSLQELLEAAGLPSTNRFPDAGIVSLSNESGQTALTVDLLYDIGVDPFSFGYISLIHGISDLYATLAEPVAAVVTLGITPTDLRSDWASKVLQGFRQASADFGVAFEGGHTVWSSQRFLNVASVGVNAVDLSVPSIHEATDFDIYLSKPVGTGLYISALQNSILDISYIPSLLTLMKTANADAARSLRQLHDYDPSTLAFVTDVTGFGLALSVHNCIPKGWVATIDVVDVPSLPISFDLINQHAVTTSLGEQNMIEVRDCDHCKLVSVSVAEELLVGDPQTSGGLLAAVRTGVGAPTSSEDCKWSRIGRMSFDGDPVIDGRLELRGKGEVYG